MVRSTSREPSLSIRGTVEGFYGPPWSHAERLAHLEFSARCGLNTYVYAPKDDPYHRTRWRDAYPARQLVEITELARHAHALGIRFVYAISPGLDMRFTDDEDYLALEAKAGQLWDAGVESFALFFDDVPAELTRPEEIARYSAEAGAAAAAHGETCTRFVHGFLSPRGVREPLLVCPVDYAGTDVSAYRRQFARTAPPDAIVAWTGRDIVVREVTRDDIDRAAASYQRRILLWDNFPVNDFDPARLFLGPLTGRTADVDGSALVGVLANPMVQAIPSRLPLATVADWAHDPHGYDPAASARRALDTVAKHGSASLAPLVRACRAWPPSDGQDPELIQAAHEAMAGKADALELLIRRLDELGRGCREAREPQSLVSALRPWLDAGTATAQAGLSAARLLRASTADGPPPPAERIELLREETTRALAQAESHYANVLRFVVPPFVRDVLDRTAPAGLAGIDEQPKALVLAGVRPTAGDYALAELLERGKYAVHRVNRPTARDLDSATVVVVTAGVDPSVLPALARLDIPLLAWHGLVELGLTHASEIVTLQDRVRITDRRDPLAAGHDGVVSVYRGPGTLTAADVGPHAHVVARTVDDGRPVLFRYPTGSRLADGTRAPAARTGLFLGRDGLAPWLLTEEGRAIVAAAVNALRDPPGVLDPSGE